MPSWVFLGARASAQIEYGKNLLERFPKLAQVFWDGDVDRWIITAEQAMVHGDGARPSEQCEIDHTMPYPAGPTHQSNCKLYCRTQQRPTGKRFD
ncbi:hypothetical protein [Mycolicibacterium sp. OfavD-34-C]|uniref:hypothetical protein n=1 Tax=Mycolicibacterium sp. OfavD-34-C TaxID=2917746 RepID=UPI001EF461B2|nr:hypothetical protein [Mycolicibacterium sp. OfavD-34-C]MCG7583748.1 hypothetical protein [Mycolicibacterium sp. OfavD-34-C]